MEPQGDSICRHPIFNLIYNLAIVIVVSSLKARMVFSEKFVKIVSCSKILSKSLASLTVKISCAHSYYSYRNKENHSLYIHFLLTNTNTLKNLSHLNYSLFLSWLLLLIKSN